MPSKHPPASASRPPQGKFKRILSWNHFFSPSEEVPICVFPMPFHRFCDRAPHGHEFDELIVVTGGAATHTQDNATSKMQRGDVFFIPKGHEHQICCPKGSKATLINVLFDFDRMQIDWSGLENVEGFANFFLNGSPERPRMHQKTTHLQLSADELARVVSTVHSIEWELAKQAPGFGFFSKIQLARLIGMLSRQTSHIPPEATRWTTRLAPLISFMEERLTDSLSVGAIARAAGMSESNLRKTFQMVFMESPVHHLHRLRVEKSLEMLADNDKSITDIALKVGFNDGNYYNRVFRKIMGISPSEYRRKPAPAPSEKTAPATLPSKPRAGSASPR